MKKLLIFVFISVLSFNVYATAYTWGTFEDWDKRIDSAVTYIEAESSGKELDLSKETIIEALHVIGFIEGIRDGYMIDMGVQLRKQHGEDIPNEIIDNIPQGICMIQPYFEIIENLNKFMAKSKYEKDKDFMAVFIEFVEEQYPCK